jgi:hypothetical protein
MATRITGRKATVMVKAFDGVTGYSNTGWTILGDTFNWEANITSENREATAHGDFVQRIIPDLVRGTFRAERYTNATTDRASQVYLLTGQQSGGSKVWVRAYNSVEAANSSATPSFAAVVTLTAANASTPHADMVKETLEGEISDIIQHPVTVGTLPGS